MGSWYLLFFYYWYLYLLPPVRYYTGTGTTEHEQRGMVFVDPGTKLYDTTTREINFLFLLIDNCYWTTVHPEEEGKATKCTQKEVKYSKTFHRESNHFKDFQPFKIWCALAARTEYWPRTCVLHSVSLCCGRRMASITRPLLTEWPGQR